MQAEPLRTVGLVTMATGRYVEFIPALAASAREHLRALGPIFVLTDATEISGAGEIHVLAWERMEWPLPTLLRYRAFTKYAQTLSQVDVLLYCDADMLFVGEVNVTRATGLIAVKHPGYVTTPAKDLPFERRPDSSAFVRSGDGHVYFCGGVQGGAAERYLNAAAEIDRRIAADEARGITAVWHDESQWNRHLVENPPQMELGAEFCTPDVDRRVDSRILALTKDHVRFRELRGFARVAARVMQVRHSLALILKGSRLSSPTRS